MMEDTLGYFDSFPIGYRFCPTEEELVTHYLLKKVKNENLPKNKIGDVNIYKHHPEYIVENHPQAKEGEWYFFTPRNRKYVNGNRPNRAAGRGYWKATGPDKEIFDDKGTKIGAKKSLVYYVGKPPNGTKTDWIMQEYVATGHQRQRFDNLDMKLDDYVLCKIHKKEEKGGKKVKEQVASDQQPLVVSNQEASPTFVYIGNNVVEQKLLDYRYQNMGFRYDLVNPNMGFARPVQNTGFPPIMAPVVNGSLLTRFNNMHYLPNPAPQVPPPPPPPPPALIDHPPGRKYWTVPPENCFPERQESNWHHPSDNPSPPHEAGPAFQEAYGCDRFEYSGDPKLALTEDDMKNFYDDYCRQLEELGHLDTGELKNPQVPKAEDRTERD